MNTGDFIVETSTMLSILFLPVPEVLVMGTAGLLLQAQWPQAGVLGWLKAHTVHTRPAWP